MCNVCAKPVNILCTFFGCFCELHEEAAASSLLVQEERAQPQQLLLANLCCMMSKHYQGKEVIALKSNHEQQHQSLHESHPLMTCLDVAKLVLISSSNVKFFVKMICKILVRTNVQPVLKVNVHLNLQKIKLRSVALITFWKKR